MKPNYGSLGYSDEKEPGLDIHQEMKKQHDNCIEYAKQQMRCSTCKYLYIKEKKEELCNDIKCSLLNYVHLEDIDDLNDFGCIHWEEKEEVK